MSDYKTTSLAEAYAKLGVLWISYIPQYKNLSYHKNQWCWSIFGYEMSGHL